MSIAQQETPPGRETPIPIELDRAKRTPVYGTAEPTSGPAEALRRQAYGYPTHHPNHWLLLMLADRIEVAGTLAREAVTPGRQGLVLRHFARQARSYPRGFAAAGLTLAGLMLWLLRKGR